MSRLSIPMPKPANAWLLLFVPGLVAFVVGRGALAWDGAYYFFRILDEQSPVIFHERFPAVVFTVPTWFAHLLTSSNAVLQIVFGASYAIVPLLILWAAARLGRPGDRGWLAIAFGILFVPIQFFAVSEALVAAQLAWPLALIVRDRSGARWLLVGAAIALTMVTLHPASFISLGAIAFGAVVLRFRKHSAAGRWGLIVGGAAVLRLLLPKTDYDTEASNWLTLKTQFAATLSQEPVIALVLGLITGVLFLFGMRRAAPLTAMLAGLVLAHWATRNAVWASLLDYRAVIGIVSAPLLVLCMIDTKAGSDIRGRAARPIAIVAAVSFSVVLCLQSLAWSNDLQNFQRNLQRAQGPCVTIEELNAGPAVPKFWTNSVLSVVVQGREPSVMVSDDLGCGIIRSGQPISIGGAPEPETGGWYELPPPPG